MPTHPEPTRRDLLRRSAALAALLAGAARFAQSAHAQAGWNKAAFDAKTVDDVLRALAAGKPVESPDIVLTAPDIAENGAVVPVGISTTLAGVKRVAFLVEKNPNTLAGVFELSDAVDAKLTTRIKMGQTSNVYAMALMADGRVLFAQKEVKVTLGGCGG